MNKLAHEPFDSSRHALFRPVSPRPAASLGETRLHAWWLQYKANPHFRANRVT